MSQTPLDRLCFQVKDILRNYGKQQTAEGTMTAEVIMDYMMFIKFFEKYSKELHGDRSLKVYEKMVYQDPSIARMTLKSFMAPYIEQKRNGKKTFSDGDISDLVVNEHMLHQVLKTTHPTSTIFDHTLSLYDRLQHDECVLRILEAIYLSDVKLDDVGDIHEYFIQDEGKSKSKMYGQFFTPNEICMKAMELVQPKLKPDGSIPYCLDPAAGSFKFMRNLAKHLSETSGKPYEEILLNHCYGCEIETKAYRSLQFNIVMETGDISENVYNANSLKYLMYGKVANDKQMVDVSEYDTEKRYDYIFANPPFGCKTELEMIQRNANDKVDKKTKAIGNYKMKTKNSDGMFLQLIINLLKDGGEACIVMCGSIFNKDWVPLRKHWLETCVINSITVCPKDSFKNTSIESYLINFKKGGKTEEVNYYHFSDGMIGTRSVFDDTYDLSVPRNNITHQSDNHKYVKLGDVVLIEKGTFNTKHADNTGTYPFYTAGLSNPTHTHSNHCFDGNEYILMVKSGGNAKKQISEDNAIGKVYLAQGKAGANTEVVKITPVDTKQLTTRYIYYALWSLRHRIQEEAKYTTGLGHLDMTGFKNIEIPLIPLLEQDKLAKKLEALDHNISLTKQKIEADKEYMKILLETETWGCDKVRLGDLLERHSNGKTNSTSVKNEGDYPFYAARAENPCGKHTSFDFEGDKYFLFAKSGGNSKNPTGEQMGIGKFWLVKGKSAGNIAMIQFTIKSQYVSYEYLDIALKSKLYSIQSLAGYTTGNGNISIDDLLALEVAVPDATKQSKLIEKHINLQKALVDHKYHIQECEQLKENVLCLMS